MSAVLCLSVGFTAAGVHHRAGDALIGAAMASQ